MTEKAFYEKHPIISAIISAVLAAIVSVVGTWLFIQKDSREAAEEAIVKNTQMIVDKIADEFEGIDKDAEINAVLGQLKKDYDEAMGYKAKYDTAMEENTKNEEKTKALEEEIVGLTADIKQKDGSYAELNKKYENLKNLLLNSNSEEVIKNAEDTGSVRVKNWKDMYEIKAFSSECYYLADSFEDNYGEAHGKTAYFSDVSSTRYSRFKLENKYDVFTFKFGMESSAFEDAEFLVEFFVDGYPVKSFEKVTKQTPADEHTIPANGDVFEIRVTCLERHEKLFFVDGRFKNLE